MIEVLIAREDDTAVCAVWMRTAPKVRQLLWLTGTAKREEIKKAHGATAFVVTDVAHFVNPDWQPGTHTGEPVHTITAYVRPVLSKARK